VGDPAGFVYAITDGESLKLGRSAWSPMIRLRSLQTGNSRQLRLLAWRAGDADTEAQLKHRYARYRVEGGGTEWFAICEPILLEVSRWRWLDIGLWHELMSMAEDAGPILPRSVPRRGAHCT
jgi:hypothetical protein